MQTNMIIMIMAALHNDVIVCIISMHDSFVKQKQKQEG